MTAALAVAAVLAAPAGALAAEAPTLGPPTVIPAGQPSPIDVGANNLHQHGTIAPGTQLLRWPVTMQGASNAPVTLTCPGTTVASGLGTQEGSQVYPTSPDGRFYETTTSVRFVVAPKADPNSATGHVYVLCRDTTVAPRAPGYSPARIYKAGRRSPISIADAGLHSGARIRKGTQVLRWSVFLFQRSPGVVTLPCPRGTVFRGLGMLKGTSQGAALTMTGHSHYGHSTMTARFKAPANARYNENTASVYALCSAR